jgi:curli biogenesis system outer membrane secretion channel CsgG
MAPSVTVRPTLRLVLLALTAVAVWAQTPQQQRRVAVFDFDNAAVQGGVSNPFFQASVPNLGKAAADLLITKLVEDGKVRVIERSEIDKLLAEQNLSNSEHTDPQTAAKLGKVLGVDAIILGTITRYDYADNMTGGGGYHYFGGASTKTKHDITAKVEINTRLVSPDTAEVLAVSKGTGEIDKKGVKEDIRDSSNINKMMNGNANNPLMNECADKAIAQLAAQLEQEIVKLPYREPTIEGLVADVSESGQMVLNVGAHDGLKVGDHLQVWRAGKEIRDPATAKLLTRDDTLLGEAIVTKVNDNFAVAIYQGTEAVKVKDLVKTIPKQH